VSATRLANVRAQSRDNDRMKVSAKADYAVRAAIEIAASDHFPVKAERIADRQAIPLSFLHKILHGLRMAGLIRTSRGSISKLDTSQQYKYVN
jgi:Iron-dependent Transcriptional regulator